MSVEEFIELYSNGENQDPSLAEPDPLPSFTRYAYTRGGKGGKGSGSARLVTPAGKQVGESESSDKPLLPPAGSAAPHIQHTQHTHLQYHYWRWTLIPCHHHQTKQASQKNNLKHHTTYRA